MQLQTKNSYVSRKQCILAAIESELKGMAMEHPRKKVAFVLFSNDVAIVGDGTGPTMTIKDD